MKKLIKIIVGFIPSLIVTLLIINSCKHDTVNLSSYQQICFNKTILPIFKANCGISGCHDESTATAGLVLTNYEGIMKGISAGNADKSEIYSSITNVWGELMPPDRVLPQELRTLIRLWIEQGAVNDTTCVEDTSTYNGTTLISSYGSLISHNEGQNCVSCHVNGGASDAWFTVAGTIYDSLKLNPYPNATIKFYTEANGQGALVATIETDGKGNFYTTEPFDFSAQLYPQITGTNNEIVAMSFNPPTGNCFACHGSVTDVIYISGIENPIIINDSICYTRDIQPILTSNCALSGCHDLATHQNDYIFTNYNYTMNSGTVISGNPENSLLYKALISTEDKNIFTDAMPPSPYSQLDTSQINLIYKWIDEGAINRNCDEDPCDLTNVTYSGVISPIITNSCKGCHSGTNPAGSISLVQYTDIKSIANSGQLLGVINQTYPFPLMPPGNPLTDCKKAQIEVWVNAGANNDK